MPVTGAYLFYRDTIRNHEQKVSNFVLTGGRNRGDEGRVDRASKKLYISGGLQSGQWGKIMVSGTEPQVAVTGRTGQHGNAEGAAFFVNNILPACQRF